MKLLTAKWLLGTYFCTTYAVDVAVCGRVAFPSAEVRCIERDGTSEVIYGGIVPRMNTTSLGTHSGTDPLWSCFACHHFISCIPGVYCQSH